MDVELLRGRVPKTRAHGDGLNGGRALERRREPDGDVGGWAVGAAQGGLAAGHAQAGLALASHDRTSCGAGRGGIASGPFWARFRRYLAAAGLAPAGLRVLRPTAAKLRHDAGASVEAVSSFLDHSSLAVMTVYLRRLEGETDRTWPDAAVTIGVWPRRRRQPCVERYAGASAIETSTS